jgi:hypothetical protein
MNGEAMAARPAAERWWRFPLPPHPIAAEQARTVARLAVGGWGMEDITDDASLVVVELVTNAAKIGQVFALTLSCQDDTLLIEVSDNSEASPEPQQCSFDRVDGRGLLLVEAYSKDWGWRLDATGGKTVWAVLSKPATTAIDSSAPPM